MSFFRERDQIDRVLHPERGYVSPLRPDPPMFWDLPEYQGDPSKGPSASNYLQYLGESSRDPNFDPTKKIGNLDDKSNRLQALNEMTQQNSGDSMHANEQCGAYVLLGGAMLAGGNKGITELMNSVEKFNKVHGGSADPETLKKESAEFQAIRDKLKKGEELTAGDLNTIAGGVYDMMRSPGKDGSDAGMNANRVDNLFRDSPALAKMWKDSDLSYDRIDGTGAGVGSHAVLGIGHSKNDKEHTGEHGAVYDPFRRTHKDPELQRRVADAAQEVDRLESKRAEATDPALIAMYAKERDAAKVLLQQAQDREKAAHHNLGQVVTDAKSVGMYRAATRESIEIGPDGKPKHNMLKPTAIPGPSIWDGMY